MALYDLTAERQWLGEMSVNPEIFDRTRLQPEDFYHRMHELVFRAAYSLRLSGEEVDQVSIRRALDDQIRGKGDKDEADYIQSFVPPMSPPESLEGRILELGRKRRFREQLLKGAAACEEGSLDTAVELVGGSLGELEKQTHAELLSAADCLQDAYDNLNLGKSLCETGIASLDEAIGGFGPGELAVFGAGTGTGKSWFTLYVAASIAKKGNGPVGVISLEDSSSTWGSRIAAEVSDIPASDFRKRKVDEAAFQQARAAAHKLPVILAMNIEGNIFYTVQLVQKMVREHGCKLIAVDYIQCFQGIEDASRHQAISRMVGMLKAATAKAGVPLLLTSQLSRQDPKRGWREPVKDDLKESGDIANKAEYVILGWRLPDGQDPDTIHFKVDKSKSEGTGTRFSMTQIKTGALRQDLDAFEEEEVVYDFHEKFP